MIPKLLVGVFLVGVVAQPVGGHGFLHEEIAILSARLKKQPNNAELLVRRAQLYREHRQPEAARADLKHALFQDSRLPSALLAMARLEREAGNVVAAKEAMASLLEQHADNVEALTEKARIHESLKEWVEAAETWQNLLDRSEDTSASVALSCARALCRISPADFGGARAVLERALSHHPRVIALHQELAAVWIRLKHFEKAGQQLDQLHAIYPGLSPRLLVEEATLWQEHGRKKEATLAWRQARGAFAKLSAHRQSLPGFQSLKAQIDDALTVPLTDVLP